MSNLPLLIDIGYPKAASTWLQRTIFNNEKIGFTSPFANQLGHTAIAIDEFLLTNSFHFYPEKAYKVLKKIVISLH